LDTETIIMSPTHADGTRLRRLRYPMTLMTFSCLAPVLSAQKILLPNGRPRATCGLYSTIPFALTALVLGTGISCHFGVSAKSELFFFNVLILVALDARGDLLDCNE
jgi:hypothetical protein